MFDKINLKFVVVGYCFFSLFHLLPVFLYCRIATDFVYDVNFIDLTEFFSKTNVVLFCLIFLISIYVNIRTIDNIRFETSVAVIQYWISILLVQNKLKIDFESFLWGNAMFLLIITCCISYVGGILADKSKLHIKKLDKIGEIFFSKRATMPCTFLLLITMSLLGYWMITIPKLSDYGNSKSSMSILPVIPIAWLAIIWIKGHADKIKNSDT